MELLNQLPVTEAVTNQDVNNWMNDEELCELSEAVSYTHLDVYKRQDLHGVGRNNIKTSTQITSFQF